MHRIGDLSAQQLIHICKQLSELFDLNSDMGLGNFSVHNLFELIRNAESLTAFRWFRFDMSPINDTVDDTVMANGKYCGESS